MYETVTELVNIWDKVKKELADSIEDPKFFDVFLSDSSIHSIEGNTMTVAVTTKFAASVLSSQYLDKVQNSVKNVVGSNLKVKFDIPENLKNSPVQTEEKPQYFKNVRINKTLTFDSFITGQSNLEAKQASMLIASNPGKQFNPLFVYSNPGLGKTHLLQAIVNYINVTQPGKKALYCEATDFLNEFVTYATGHIQEKSLQDFISNFDVLLIDDIQILANKVQTQAFFFAVFEKFYNQGKQVIITSDKHPSELKGFEERLQSRFGQGLTVSINQPDSLTCEGIIRSKISNGPIDLNAFDPKVISFIAEKFSKNIRDIDQALNKLVFHVTAFKPTKYIDMDTAMEALQSLIDVKDAKKKLNEQRIINTVAEYYSLTPSQLIGPSRQGDVALARHISMYLIRALLDVPFTKIGFIFGGKDHSTVMNGVTKVENSLKNNVSLQTAVNDIKSLLK